MKLAFCLLFVLLNNTVSNDHIVLRQLFSIASIDEIANKKLIDITESADLKKETLEYAYHAGGLMSMANHVYWPGTKLSYFNQGKEKLEKAVNFELRNVEIRFIRYSIQKNVPAILDYKINMQEDKQFILDNINTTDWTATYKQEVKDFLND